MITDLTILDKLGLIERRSVEMISSKSEVHRALIANFLSGNKCQIVYRGSSKDISATKKSLEALTLSIRDNTHKNNYDKNIELQVGESGTTLRLLFSIAGLMPCRCTFLREGRLAHRPMEPLLSQLTSHGMTIREEGSRLITSGKLTSGDFVLDGGVSSQFISSLLLTLPLLEGKSTLTIRGQLSSRSYVDLTLKVMRDFGVEVVEKDNVFYVEGEQRYYRSGKYFCYGDWSNVAFWVVASKLSKKDIKVKGLDKNSLQGDKKIIDIGEGFGIKFSWDKNDLNILGSKSTETKEDSLRIIDIDQIPDMVPALSLMAALSKGRTKIINGSRLRLKESDRITSVREVLSSLGANIVEDGDSLIIDGVEELRGGEVSSYNDHRIAMMAAIASLRTKGQKVIIKDSKAVEKSYEDFYNILFRLFPWLNLELR